MKKKVFIIALAVCLVAAIAAGSLAYFTKERSITNDFMTASYNPEDPYTDPDDIFNIKLDETSVADPSKRVASGTQAFTNLQPGDTRTKDPTVTNTGLYDEYVRVSLTASNYSDWAEILAKWEITDLANLFGGFNAKFERKEETIDAEADTITYVYYLNRILKPGESETLFKTFTLPAVLDVEDMLALQEFSLVITADAIQSAHTAVDSKGVPKAGGAFEAFSTYWDVNMGD